MSLEKIGSWKFGEIPIIPIGIVIAVLIVVPHILPNNYWIRIAGNAGLWMMLA